MNESVKNGRNRPLSIFVKKMLFYVINWCLAFGAVYLIKEIHFLTRTNLVNTSFVNKGMYDYSSRERSLSQGTFPIKGAFYLKIRLNTEGSKKRQQFPLWLLGRANKFARY